MIAMRPTKKEEGRTDGGYSGAAEKIGSALRSTRKLIVALSAFFKAPVDRSTIRIDDHDIHRHCVFILSALAINGSGLIAHSRADDRCAVGCEPEPIAGAPSFKLRTVPAGMFAFYVLLLRRNWYRPVNLRPGEKRPQEDNWDRLRETPLSDEEIARISQHAGLSVAGGRRRTLHR